MTPCLDVSRGPLDLRPWPVSQVVTARIAAHGRTMPGGRTRQRIARVDVGPRGERSAKRNAQEAIRSEMFNAPGPAPDKSDSGQIRGNQREMCGK